jgi:GDSL-like Lipase/Acylhydrolase family
MIKRRLLTGAAALAAYAAAEISCSAALVGTRRALLGGSKWKLPRWRAARARSLSGGLAQISCIGTSTTLGNGSDGSLWTNAKVYSYPRQLATLMTAAGLPANDTSVLGDGRGGLADFLLADTRVTTAGGWVEFGSESLAGFMFANSTDTDSFSFTPNYTFDTIDIYDVTNSGYAQWTVNVDGGSPLATVSPSGSTRLRKTTVSCTLGTHTINLQTTSPAEFIIVGIVARKASFPGVLVHNQGAYASQASFWNTSANVWSPLPTIETLAPDLSIINIGTNEWINGVSVATFLSNMQPLIAACLLSGDVLLNAPCYENPANGVSITTQQAIINACYQLAADFGISLIDLTQIIGSYAAGSAAGYYYSDGVHLTQSGYAQVAQANLAAVLS